MTKTDLPPEVTTPESESRPPLLAVIAIAVVLVAAIGFRFSTRANMWLDEALAVNIAHLPTRHIFTWLKHDGAPPLYYVLLHYWMKVFGTSNLGARSLTGVVSVATLPLGYFCGKRIGGRRLAWTTLVVLCVSTYVVTYATTARMYELEQFLVFAGILAVRRAFDAPTWRRAALVGLLIALLIYTQYWGFYVAATLALILLGALRYRPEHRLAAQRMLIAVAVGLLTFIPWVPTFLYQAKHTGTPWGSAVFPAATIGQQIQDFSGGQRQEGWVLWILFVVLIFLGTFGLAVREGHIDINPHAQPSIRWEAAFGGATLVLGASATYLSGNAYQSRYGSVVLPVFVLLIARGITTLANPRVRVFVLMLIVALGWTGNLRNLKNDRTSATVVAPIINREGQPGDLVLYCPDQVGPAVHRLLHRRFDEVTYPRLLRPALVDWVDYKAVLARYKPSQVAQEVLDRAGSHTIWYVSAPGYTTHKHSCDQLSSSFAQARKEIVRVASNPDATEKQGLEEFPAG